MQIRYKTELTFDEYREQEGWKQVRLERCPLHPEGGCGIARHGYYERKHPEPCLITRYYCSASQVSIGLLPDFFASRLPGTLNEVEDAVNVAEFAGITKRRQKNFGLTLYIPTVYAGFSAESGMSEGH
jgi:hypothetical protein